MNTTLAFLDQFGDAIDFIFNERESPAGGSEVGGLAVPGAHAASTSSSSLVAIAVACAIVDPARALAGPHRQGRLPGHQRLQRGAGGAQPRPDRVLRRLPRRGLHQPHAGARAARHPAHPHQRLHRRAPGRPRHGRRRAGHGHDRRADRAPGGAAAGAAADLRRHSDLDGERGGHGHDRPAGGDRHARRPDHQRQHLRRRRAARGRHRRRPPGRGHRGRPRPGAARRHAARPEARGERPTAPPR